jgi:hypothetical protein
VHGADGLVGFQERDDRGRVLLVDAHPRRQRPQPSQGEVAVEGRPGEPEAVRPPRELLAQRRVLGDDRAPDDVAVAVQVLRRRVHDEVGSESQRLLEHRREEGVVDDDERPGRAGAVRDPRDVDEAQERVARRLDPHEARLGGQGLRQGGRVVLVDEPHADPGLALVGVQQPERAAVAVVRGQDEIARLEQVQDERDRGHPRRGDDRSRAALEVGQGSGQQIARRVRRPRVVVGSLQAEPFEGVVRREVQGRHHRAVQRIRGDAGPDCARGVVEAAHDDTSRVPRRTSDSASTSLRKPSCP